MESDTDSDCELPPGWEKCSSNDQTIYINHINKSTQITSPLKDLRIKGSMFKSSYSKRSCGFNNIKYKSEEFVQKFDAFSTAEQVIMKINLSSKQAVVIGGCSGIGLEIVHHLVSRNCSVIIGSPNITKCSSDIIMKIGEENFYNFVTMFTLDLTNSQMTKMFCNFVLQNRSAVDMIIMCAGIMNPPYILTTNGFESTFQVNVISQFYIIESLLSTYGFSNCECRVIWLSCESHRAVKELDILSLNPPPQDYNGLQSYALSNLCRIILTKQLKKKWESRQCIKKPLFFVCHPGNMVHGTNITRYHRILKIIFWIFSPFTKSLSQAAATPLMCCISNSMKKFSGSYLNNGCICEPSVLALNEENQKTLWSYLTDIITKLDMTSP